MAVLVRRRDLAPQPVGGFTPFPEIRELQEQMAQLMQQVVATDDDAPWVPLVDIEETDATRVARGSRRCERRSAATTAPPSRARRPSGASSRSAVR